jgi:hypothetical protein
MALVCGVSVSTHAGSSYTLTSEAITTAFFPGDPIDPLPRPAEAVAWLATGGGEGKGSAMPNLTADFSDPDKTITFRLLAPTGRMFFITPPSGFDESEFKVRLTAGTEGIFIGNPLLQSFSFDLVSGSAPAVTYGRFIANGEYFNAEVSATLNGPLSFTAMTIVWNVPAGYNESFVDEILSDQNNIYIRLWDTTGEASDPGSWVTLKPFPPVLSGKLFTHVTGQAANVAGAAITVIETGTSSTSDVNGYYAFFDIPSGTYTLAVQMAPFSTTQVHDVVVTEGQETIVPDQEMTIQAGDATFDGLIGLEDVIYDLQVLTGTRANGTDK